jgi:hypothetical protein
MLRGLEFLPSNGILGIFQKTDSRYQVENVAGRQDRDLSMNIPTSETSLYFYPDDREIIKKKSHAWLHASC